MKILICTDGRKHAEDAISFSTDFFSKVKPKAIVLYVDVARKAENKEAGEGYLNRAKKILDRSGISTRTKIRIGKIVEEIIAETREGKYDLIVLGSRGITETVKGLGGVILSDITREVIERIRTSVLVVKEPRELGKVLICTDGSPASLEAARFWGKLKKNGKIKVNVVNVVPEIYHRFKDFLEPVAEEQLELFGTLPGKRTEYLYKTKEILAKYDIKAGIRLREGHAAEEILREAERDYDLIVMGFRGRKEKKKPTIGRHSLQVIQGSKISVLAIKQK